MKIPHKFLVVTFITTSFSIHSQDINILQPINIGFKTEIHSKILGKDREIQIFLPKSYDETTTITYPTMYLFDGDLHFHSASGIISHMSSGQNFNYQIPEMIIVAIDNINFNQRRKDLTPTEAKIFPSGQGNLFMSFIEDELIPFINKNYRTTPFNLLVGHSLGGLMAIHTYLKNPNLFNSYIAIDSSFWWDNELILNMSNCLTKDHNKNGKNSIYIAIAEQSGQYNIDLGRKINRQLTELNLSGLRTKLEVIENENHGSIPLIALYKGLSFIFDSFPNKRTSISNKDEILASFKKVSNNLGPTIKPPFKYINQIGDILLYQRKDIVNAIDIYNINLFNYPEEPLFYNKIAKAYFLDNKLDLAKKNYEETLKIESENIEALNGLKAIGNQLKN